MGPSPHNCGASLSSRPSSGLRPSKTAVPPQARGPLIGLEALKTAFLRLEALLWLEAIRQKPPAAPHKGSSGPFNTICFVVTKANARGVILFNHAPFSKGVAPATF